MNCSKCGLQSQPDQKFCRSCGTSLQLITQPLAESATISKLERGEENQRANSLMLWGLVIMFVGVAIGIIGKKLIHEEIVTVVGALVSLAGMFLAVYPYLSPLPRRKYDSSPSSQPEALAQPQPAKSLPQGSNIEYVPSVTERTTDLLKNSAATRAKEKEKQESQDIPRS